MSKFSSLCNNIVDFGSKKSNARTEKIIKITPHHMAGNILAGDCAKMHRDGSREASANYYIGSDGFIVGGVSEDRRAWTSSSSWNDQRAITIEVANNSGEPNWTVSDAAYKSLVKLCADICKRYGIDPHCDGTKNGTITYHRMFVATSCPGPYLKGKFDGGTFEKDVKAAMGEDQQKPDVSDILYRVQTGAFSKKENADAQLAKVKAAGFDTYMVQVGSLYKIQVGAYAKSSNAEAMAAKLKAAGFDTYITTQSGTAVKEGTAKKSIDEVAREVIAGKWGNGKERFNALEKAGYDASAVQDRVNELLK
ncbi:MAG: N-acetylmuramoyl-L-alanine amidase [Eubacterium sp.]|nr:N-acetylmuramoyl-L-alanine amidase [Eubacterium sp.]